MSAYLLSTRPESLELNRPEAGPFEDEAQPKGLELWSKIPVFRWKTTARGMA